MRETENESVRFRVLGPLEIAYGLQESTPTAPKVLQVLALLVLRANRIVHSDTLIQQLWGERPPRSATTTVQTYIYQLRRFFEREGFAANGEDLVVTRMPGYMLRVQPGQIDLQDFERLNQQGQLAMGQGRFADAADRLRSALALCSGTPLVNVQLSGHLVGHVAELQEQQRMTLQLRIQAEMELGMHRELIGELKSLVALHPLDEWLHGQLIRVLDRSGRRSDALVVYHSLRRTLYDELGLDPSSEVQAIHHQLISAG